MLTYLNALHCITPSTLYHTYHIPTGLLVHMEHVAATLRGKGGEETERLRQEHHRLQVMQVSVRNNASSRRGLYIFRHRSYVTRCHPPCNELLLCLTSLLLMRDLCCVRDSRLWSRSGKCCRRGQQRMQLLCGRRPETLRLRAGGYKSTKGTTKPHPIHAPLPSSSLSGTPFCSLISAHSMLYLVIFQQI